MAIERIVVTGNSGGGKSTLARRLAASRGVPHIEIDRLLWRPGWQLTPPAIYEEEHSRLVAQESWLIDGLGRRESIPARLAKATEIILVDMPLWTHFWLAAERQIAWVNGRHLHPPGGYGEMPPLRELFRTIHDVDHEWMPEIRQHCAVAAERGIRFISLESIEALERFATAA